MNVSHYNQPSHTENSTQSFINSNFLLVQTSVKLRNSNFFQAFAQILGIYIIRKIFPKYMDPVTYMA